MRDFLIFIGVVLLIAFLIDVIQIVIEYWYLIAGLIAIAALVWAWIKAEEEKSSEAAFRVETERLEENARLARLVKTVTKADSLRGFDDYEELGWVEVEADSRSEAESELKAQAGKLGANAIVKLHFEQHEERYQAGTGPKGNPYFKKRRYKIWEGLAISTRRLEALRRQEELARPTQGTKSISSHSLVILDGSNVMHWGNEKEPDLEIVQKVIAYIGRPEAIVVFFDANVGYRVFGENVSSETLAQEIGVPVANLTVVPAGVKADEPMLKFAQSRDAVVVSNDRFNEYTNYSNVSRVSGQVIMGEVSLND